MARHDDRYRSLTNTKSNKGKANKKRVNVTSNTQVANTVGRASKEDYQKRAADSRARSDARKAAKNLKSSERSDARGTEATRVEDAKEGLYKDLNKRHLAAGDITQGLADEVIAANKSDRKRREGGDPESKTIAPSLPEAPVRKKGKKKDKKEDITENQAKKKRAAKLKTVSILGGEGINRGHKLGQKNLLSSGPGLNV